MEENDVKPIVNAKVNHWSTLIWRAPESCWKSNQVIIIVIDWELESKTFTKIVLLFQRIQTQPEKPWASGLNLEIIESKLQQMLLISFMELNFRFIDNEKIHIIHIKKICNVVSPVLLSVGDIMGKLI